MNDIISIKNISFSYGKNDIFKNFSLDVEKGDFVTIIGPNGSGKSTLVRILLGLEKTDGEIYINTLKMNHKNIREIMSKIGAVLENPDDQFVAETVMHEIAFSLENMQVEANEIRKKVNKMAEYIGIEDLLEKEPHSLSGGQKQLVSLAAALVIEPDILILDEAFTMLDVDTKERVYKKLIALNESKSLTIINVSHDTEDTLYGNKILVLNKGQNVLYGLKEDVLLEEKKFNNLGLSLPFMAELSIKLKYYELVDKIILDMDEMVNALWK